MAKKCKNCGAVVEDAVTICSSCNNFGFEEMPKVEYHRLRFKKLLKLSQKIFQKNHVFYGGSHGG